MRERERSAKLLASPVLDLLMVKRNGIDFIDFMEGAKLAREEIIAQVKVLIDSIGRVVAG